MDFFILANKLGLHHFIIDLDVHQGKNLENVFIPGEI